MAELLYDSATRQHAFRHVSWSLEGNRIAVCDGSYVMLINVLSQRLVECDLGRPTEEAYWGHGFVVVRDLLGRLTWVDMGGKKTKEMRLETGAALWVAPGAEKIICRMDGAYRLVASNRHQVLPMPFMGNVSWAPDTDSVLYSDWGPGPTSLWRYELGSGRTETLIALPYRADAVVFGKGHRRAATAADGSYQVWSLETKEMLCRVRPEPGLARLPPEWIHYLSPDLTAYMHDKLVGVTPPGGLRPLELGAYARSDNVVYRWAPDSRSLLIVGLPARRVAVVDEGSLDLDFEEPCAQDGVWAPDSCCVALWDRSTMRVWRVATDPGVKRAL